MKISVKKENNKYYAVIQDYDLKLHRYDVIKSWDKISACGKIINHNLFQEQINLFKNKIDMFSIFIELEPLKNCEHYYTIILSTEDEVQYPFHIDINMFYNIPSDSTVYFHNLINFNLNNIEKNNYDFYLIGNYGDKHKITLLNIEEPRKILFSINDKDSYISEIYYMSISLNETEIYRELSGVCIKDTLDFVIDIEDYGGYLKCNLYPKYKYPFLEEISVEYNNNKLLHNIKKDKRIEYSSFFIPKEAVNTYLFKINYSIKEEALNNIIKNKTKIIEKSLYKNNVFEIYDFKEKYDYNYDCTSISFKNKSNLIDRYKIILDDKYIFYTKSTSFSIKEFKKYNNNSSFIKTEIFGDCYNNFESLFVGEIHNYNFINSSIDFIPRIDYTNALVKNKLLADITWTLPTYQCYSKVKVNMKFIKQFLNEYLTPWIDEQVLDEEVSSFDDKYSNYDTLIEYDFDNNGGYLKDKVSNACISYDGTIQSFIITDSNKTTIPIWHREGHSPYTVTVEIYDKWHNLRGTNTVEFNITESQPIIPINSIWIDRNQKMQFGESGTVGEFYKIENPTPFDCRNNYGSTKTFTGKALDDYSNVDFNNKSLYYYMNSNENTENFYIKINRISNFSKLEYELLYKEKHIINKTILNINGNDFEDNIITVSKSNIQQEGEYVLNIKTFNASGVASNLREIKFYVYNSKPATPEVIINQEDFKIVDNEITINKKYFNIEITNNTKSDQYAGWNFKEAHFYFKKNDTVFNNYPDYVVQSDRSSGLISFKNTVSIENGDYDCKVIVYDYNGNASEPYSFSFKLLSEMTAIPQQLFSNKPAAKMKWKIKQSQDSDGFFYQFKYSQDGVNYFYSDPEKIENRYYVKKYYELDLNWLLKEGTVASYKEGFYNLVVYEYNYRHPSGLTEYKFESPTVEVNSVSNPSNAVNCKAIENKVAIFNPRSYDEYAYTYDLNLLSFDTIHSEVMEDDPNTEERDGQYYKIKLIDPSGNEYNAVLPFPEEIGIYTFDKIADKCNIQNQIEGVWELHFITVDKFGNSNAYRGYYSYYIVLVTRNPVITSLVPTNNNGLEYFGLNSSSVIGYSAYTSYCDDIPNYHEHSEKFSINKYSVEYLSTPLNSQYKLTLMKDTNNIIQVLDPLSDSEKFSHSKDGRYLLNIVAIDPLERKSQIVEKVFYIDTNLDCNMFFLNPSIMYKNTFDIIGSANGSVSKIYYKFYNIEEITNNFSIEEDEYLKWDSKNIETISYNNSTFEGIEIKNYTVEEDGYKVLAYVLEELSQNRTTIQFYKFLINTTVKLIPIFDYTNRTYFTSKDDAIKITWNSSSDEIEKYFAKLDKVEYLSDGGLKVVQSYNFSTSGEGLLVPVGPSSNYFVEIGSNKYIDIILNDNDNNFLVTGQYRLSIRAESKYNTFETNEYMFQIDRNQLISISDEIVENKLTLTSNKLEWNYIRTVAHYEISYDNDNFVKTYNNFFYINYSKLIPDNGKYYIYLRYKTKSGIYSESEKVQVYLNIQELKTPSVKFYEDKLITTNNNIVKWEITVEDPDIAKYLYYSFDKTNWELASITGRSNMITNKKLSSPIPDGTYDIFIMTTSDNILVDKNCNRSQMVHGYVKIFAQEIPIPEFVDLVNGQQINEPRKIQISNKIPNVDYFIYVNGIYVKEGYEISSSTLRKFNISVKAKKQGFDDIFTLISEKENFDIWSLTTNQYTININDEKVVCNIDNNHNYIEIFSMPEKKDSEVILYREKDTEQNWSILRIGDRLSLFNEWEFYITTFTTK